MQFTATQQAAIDHGEGPCRVLAGPGSGKTTVLTSRYARLVKEGVHPQRILAITFTRQSGLMMRRRIEGLIGDHLSDRCAVGTMHSNFKRILEEESGTRFHLLDGRARGGALRQIIKETGLNHVGYLEPRDFWKVIDRWRMELVLPEQAKELIDEWAVSLGCQKFVGMDTRQLTGVTGEVEQYVVAYMQAAEAYEHYQRIKQSRGWIDFTDMIFETWRMLSDNEDVRDRWRRQWDYVMVDEFQDIDPCQYNLVRILTHDHRCLFAVGDDDQSIYGFRGAKPDIFLQMNDDFEDLKTITLDRNFRCPDEVVKLTDRMIVRNAARLPKIITGTDRKARVQFSRPNSCDDEADQVADLIETFRKHRVPLHDIAVVYRTNAQSVDFEAALMFRDIPYFTRNGKSFYDMDEIAPLVEYLRLAAGREDWTTFETITNKPNRFVPKAAMEQWHALGGTMADLRLVKPPKPGNARALEDLRFDLVWVQNMGKSGKLSTVDVLNDLLHQFDYVRKMKPKGAVDDDTSDVDMAVKKLLEEARPFPRIEDFLREVDKTRAFAKRQKTFHNAVLLSTFHGVKGLEFGFVFLVGMCEGKMPHHRALEDGKIDEERRLAHVGITRTKFMVYASSPVSEGPVSRFVREWRGESDDAILKHLEELQTSTKDDSSWIPRPPLQASSGSRKPSTTARSPRSQ